MTTDFSLLEKREELRRRLAAGEYKTLVDVFLEWFERWLRKIIRRSEPFPLWATTLSLCIIALTTTNAIIYFAGDWTTYLRNGASFGLGYEVGFLINISNGFLIIIVTIIINQYINRFLILWKDSILDRTESLTSIRKMELWITICCNQRLHFLVTVAFTILSSVFGLFLVNTLPGLDIGGYGLMFTNTVNTIVSSVMAYQLMMVILLYMNLRNYDLKLFATDPGSSELILRLSNEMGYFVYLTAFFIAIFSFWYYRLEIFASSLSIVLILAWWMPIIALFVLSQTSLASIIRRAKWKTLNEIQSQVEELRASNSLKDKETMEAINRLMDFHDRVKATRDSAIDLRTILNFINSLLLPLLAFLLGNFDIVLNLFARKP